MVACCLQRLDMLGACQHPLVLTTFSPTRPRGYIISLLKVLWFLSFLLIEQKHILLSRFWGTADMIMVKLSFQKSLLWLNIEMDTHLVQFSLLFNGFRGSLYWRCPCSRTPGLFKCDEIFLFKEQNDKNHKTANKVISQPWGFFEQSRHYRK